MTKKESRGPKPQPPKSPKPQQKAETPKAQSAEPVKDEASEEAAEDAANWKAEYIKAENEKKELEAANKELFQKVEEKDAQIAKLKETAPNTQKEEVESVTGHAKKEINSSNGTVDLMNAHGLVIARGVPVEEAKKRIERAKPGQVKVVEPKSEEDVKESSN